MRPASFSLQPHPGLPRGERLRRLPDTFPNPQMYRYAPFFLRSLWSPGSLLQLSECPVGLRRPPVFRALPLIAYLLFDVIRRVSRRGDFVDNRTFAAFSPDGLVRPPPALRAVRLYPLTFWSWSYWRMWVNGKARVLQLVFLVLTVCLLLRGSRLSGLTFAC